MSVSVVVPCYKSGETLPNLAERLVTVLTGASDQHEIILVVDGSPDNTWEIAQSQANRFKSVQAMRLSRNFGQHGALLAGVRAARFDYIVTMDDDLQHPPEELPKLLTAIETGLDVVYGIPVHEEHGFFRSAASRQAKALGSAGLGIPGVRGTSAFRIFRTELRAAFEGVRGPHTSLDVALSWSTTGIGTTPVKMEHRTIGRSNYSPVRLIRHALDAGLGFSTMPLRLIVCLGLICTGLGTSLFASVIWKLLANTPADQSVNILTATLVLFSGIQLVAVGTVGEYVGRIHARSMGRPTYVVAEQTGAQPISVATPEASVSGLKA